MIPQLRFEVGEATLVPGEHAVPGVVYAGRACVAARLHCDNVTADPHVVDVAEIVLQPLQSFDEMLGLRRVV